MDRIALDSIDLPALLHVLPESRRQRILIPIVSGDELVHPDDGPGWAEGCRLIDRNRRIYDVHFDDEEYAFEPLAEQLSDEQLKQIAARNLTCLGRSADDFIATVSDFSGSELVDSIVAQTRSLPMMRPMLHFVGCAVIFLLCALAISLPIMLVVWLFM